MKEIESNQENQYYTDIATQYGKIIRLIFFDFDPSNTGSLENAPEAIAQYIFDFINRNREDDT